ncbi:uncharacterized protein LOC108933671 isoform X1 [Scleropages formosus]|uniref:uncharacterized protein LOC108933671 isoform X1 n=1 Tax=Scleropages formosus TaxID=113540 RepID=UPI0010FA73CA|nr:uncharacterized protein LOC108933671 isoform X1 [Scleropages formosus]
MSYNGFLTALLVLLAVRVSTIKCEISRARPRAAEQRAESSHGEEGYAFFALRSCHHVLRGDSGEFFSPDYLCSSPPLWCNWTIQVGSGKRIHLELEDFTPADACHLKNDQIHLDESPGSGRHRVLERCWERAVHTTHSNTVHVVLLIGKDPRPPHRGFHARYHALAPSYAQEPPHRGKHKDPNEAKVSVKLLDKSKKMVTGPLVTTFPQTLSPEDGFMGQPVSGRVATVPQTASDDGKFSITQSSNTKKLEVRNTVGSVAMWNSEGTWDDIENSLGDLGVSVHNQDGNSKERLAEFNGIEDINSKHTVSVMLNPNRQTPFLEHGSSGVHNPQSEPAEWSGLPSDLKNVEAGSWSSRTLNNNWNDQLALEPPVGHSTSIPVQTLLESGQTGGSETSLTAHAGQHPKITEPMTVSSQSQRYSRNTSQLVHLPGDYLFEVAVEVYANLGKIQNWEHFVKSLKISVETMIIDELRFNQLKAISFERIKKLSACRLHAGVLLILWLQLAEDFEGEQIYEIVSSALKQLLRKAVRLGPSRRFNSTFVASVSIEDVNECETQLVLCDIHADCINQFGSYVCHCQPGFTGASSFHSRGTDCVDIEGSTRSISPVLLQGLCALCFLLGVFLLLLLCIMGVMYRRHHHGVFLVPCQSHSCGDSESSSNTNGNGNYSNNGSNMPPPPIRHPKDRGGNAKDSFPSVGLPLLKFGPLLPSDSVRCREPNEGVKL